MEWNFSRFERYFSLPLKSTVTTHHSWPQLRQKWSWWNFESDQNQRSHCKIQHHHLPAFRLCYLVGWWHKNSDTLQTTESCVKRTLELIQGWHWVPRRCTSSGVLSRSQYGKSQVNVHEYDMKNREVCVCVCVCMCVCVCVCVEINLLVAR